MRKSGTRLACSVAVQLLRKAEGCHNNQSMARRNAVVRCGHQSLKWSDFDRSVNESSLKTLRTSERNRYESRLRVLATSQVSFGEPFGCDRQRFALGWLQRQTFPLPKREKLQYKVALAGLQTFLCSGLREQTSQYLGNFFGFCADLAEISPLGGLGGRARTNLFSLSGI
jgi:hypothetical protein